MKKFKNFTLGGIQQKVFNLVLFTILLMMAAFIAVVIYQSGQLTNMVNRTNDTQKASIQTVSEKTMEGVLQNSMTQNNGMLAYTIGEYFGDAASTVTMLGDYTAHLFADPAAYSAKEVFPPDPAKEGEISVQLVTEEGVDLSDPEIRAKLGLIGNLSDMMHTLYTEANVDSCYAALPDGVMLQVDDHPGTKFEDGKLKYFAMRERPWYVGAAETGALYFTDVTSDVFTGEICIMCSLPVYANGKLVAVIGADLFLNDMVAQLENLSQNGSFLCVVNENGHVLFSPKTEGTFRVQPAEQAQDLRNSENEALSAFVQTALTGNTGLQLVEVDGEPYYLTGAPIDKVGWTILSIVPKSLADAPADAMLEQYDAVQSEALAETTKGLNASKTTLIILLAVVVILGLTAALLLSRRIVKPLDAITRRVKSLRGNDLLFKMEPEFRTGDEIEVLAESFAMLSGKTLEYIDQVQRVTAEKERLGTELALATRIQADMLPNIYPAFPERPEFDIYASMDPAKEVGGDFYDFFLIDDDHLCMVIADVSGKGVPAALFMMASKIMLSNFAQTGKSPAQILAETNAAICANNREEMFVTVWLGILEISTGKLTAANAGHEYPVLRQPGGVFELVKDKHGFVIGGMDGVRYKEYELQLEPGARLFLYTDGVPEATNAAEELFGTDRMLEALNQNTNAAPTEVLKAVRSAVDAFVEDAEQFDDLTMLCVEYRGRKSN